MPVATGFALRLNCLMKALTIVWVDAPAVEYAIVLPAVSCKVRIGELRAHIPEQAGTAGGLGADDAQRRALGIGAEHAHCAGRGPQFDAAGDHRLLGLAAALGVQNIQHDAMLLEDAAALAEFRHRGIPQAALTDRDPQRVVGQRGHRPSRAPQAPTAICRTIRIARSSSMAASLPRKDRYGPAHATVRVGEDLPRAGRTGHIAPNSRPKERPCNSRCTRKSPSSRPRPIRPRTRQAAAGPAAATCALRSTGCAQQGDLIETEKEVDPDLEVTGLQKHMDGGCPVLFHNVKGKPGHRVITNLFGDMNVINKMFGWKDDVERTHRIARGVPQAAQAGNHLPERGAGAGARGARPEGRERVHGADPAHHLRDRADRRLRHPLHQLRPVRWRHRPRLQPHEFPLGQCRHVPDFARLPHVAGGEQILQGRPADPDEHVLRGSAGLHAVGRRRLRLRDPAHGLRRDRHRGRGAGLADPDGEVPHRRCLHARRRRDSCSKATSIRATAATRPRNPKRPASRAASISTPNGPATWARPTRRRPSTSPR